MFFRYHPDKTANDPVAADVFKELTFSYNILSDPDKRHQYDTAGFEVSFVFVFAVLYILLHKILVLCVIIMLMF